MSLWARGETGIETSCLQYSKTSLLLDVFPECSEYHEASLTCLGHTFFSDIYIAMIAPLFKLCRQSYAKVQTLTLDLKQRFSPTLYITKCSAEYWQHAVFRSRSSAACPRRTPRSSSRWSASSTRAAASSPAPSPTTPGSTRSSSPRSPSSQVTHRNIWNI